jgi:alpha-1,6-mannosyltransferase
MATAPAINPHHRTGLLTNGPLLGPPSALGGRLGVAGLLVTSLVISLSATRSELLLPSSLRPLPDWLAGPLDGFGFRLGLGVLIATFVLMFVSYAVATRAAHRLSARLVLTSIVALHALVLLGPPLFSSDVFSYVAYGRMGVLHEVNPYLQGPGVLPLEALHPLIGAQWIHTPSVYGPLFTALSYLLVPLDIAANALAYKAVAAVSSLALIAVIWHAARLRGLDSVRSVALVGLNPVVVFFGVGGGHNDLMMLAILAAGLYVLLQERERSSGALIVLATAVKLTAGLVLPFALAGRRGPAGGGPARRRLLIGFGAGAVAIAALAYALFGTGPLHVISSLQGVQSQGGAQSIFGFLATALGLGAIVGPAAIVLTATFAVTVAWLLWRVSIGELDWITGAGWATAALLVTTQFLVPWYVAWLLPLAALSSDRRLLLVALALTGIGLTTL